ncbi:MAG: hypothetical protein NW220_23035 [Leptolyngbyaceae cyanobacterium bins.349]|nr:hypothetical protein [Leptolyngbyaceae cyanobacterium bins.349]
MTTLPEVVKQSELLNQLVLNRSTMEELGRIEVLWMYPPSHRVLGFVCKTGFLGKRKLAFKLSQVDAIGANGVITHSQPDETDAERVRQLESLIQNEVWSNAGQKLGKIIDCEFNLRTGAIADYLVVGDRLSSLTGSIYRLPPHKIMSLGRERVLINETSIQQLAPYREGLQQKIAKVSTTLKDEYEDITLEMRSLVQRAQETTQQTTGQLKSLAEQAKERARLLAEEAKERAQELNEQWLENAQTLAEKAKETSETLVERVQDTTQDWGEQLKEIQTVTVPAQEIEDFDDDLDWDDDFLFEADDADAPIPPTPVQPPRPPSAPATPSNAAGTSPQTASAPVSPEEDEESHEDFWVIGDDLTLKRRTTIAQDREPFVINNDWDIDDDPWDITEPPTTATTVSPTTAPITAPTPAPTTASTTAPTTPEVRGEPTPNLDPPTPVPPPAVEMPPSPTADDEEPWI